MFYHTFIFLHLCMLPGPFLSCLLSCLVLLTSPPHPFPSLFLLFLSHLLYLFIFLPSPFIFIWIHRSVSVIPLFCFLFLHPNSFLSTLSHFPSLVSSFSIFLSICISLSIMPFFMFQPLCSVLLILSSFFPYLSILHSPTLTRSSFWFFPKDESCKDRRSNCLMVVQARLCVYSYYKLACCASCTQSAQRAKRH